MELSWAFDILFNTSYDYSINQNDLTDGLIMKIIIFGSYISVYFLTEGHRADKTTLFSTNYSCDTVSSFVFQ